MRSPCTEEIKEAERADERAQRMETRSIAKCAEHIIWPGHMAIGRAKHRRQRIQLSVIRGRLMTRSWVDRSMRRSNREGFVSRCNVARTL